MIKYIKRYFFARAVCKKLKTEFIPRLFKVDSGSYRLCVAGKNKQSKIWVSIFSDRFYEILAHEVGHLMDYKARGYRQSIRKSENLTAVDYNATYGNGDMVCMTLYRELRASRGARLLLKSWGRLEDDSMDYLSRCYATYIKGYPRSGIADVSYNGMKYLGARV